MAKRTEKAKDDQNTRPFLVLREIKHAGKRYKDGDSINLTYDEWLEMSGDGRVSGDSPAQKDTGGAPEGIGGGEGGDGLVSGERALAEQEVEKTLEGDQNTDDTKTVGSDDAGGN